MVLIGKFLSFFVCLYFIKINVCIFLYGVDHCDALKWLRKVNLDAIVGDYGAATYFLCQIAVHALCEFHHALIVCICLIQLHQCKFRIMTGIYTFITEYTANFKYTLQTANDQSFQIQFQRNTKFYVFVESIVMCLKWAGCCSTGIGYKHRSLHFHEISVCKEVTDLAKNLGTFDKCLFYVLIHDQIHITLTITDVRVRQTVKFFRKDLKTL